MNSFIYQGAPGKSWHGARCLFAATWLASLSSIGLCAQVPSKPRVSSLPQDSATIVLRAQLDEMRAERQDLLANVHWSLGIVGAVAFLLVGYSWFTNSRAYERDKESMRAALKNDVDHDFGEWRTAQLEASKTHLEQVESVATFAAKRELSSTTSEMASAKVSISELREELIGMRIEWAEDKKQCWIALRGRLQLLAIRQAENWDMRIADELQKLSELLHEDWCSLDADEASQIMASMDKLSSKHAADAEAIRARVKSLRTPEANGKD